MRQRRGRSVRLLLLLLLLLLVLVVMHRTVATALALDTIQTRTGRGRAGVGIRLGEVVGRARVAGGRCRGVLVLVELGGRGDCGGVAQLRCRKRHQAAGRGGRQVRRLVHVARWYSILPRKHCWISSSDARRERECCLQITPRLSSEDSQVDVRLATVDDGVGILARSLRRWFVSHNHEAVTPALAGLPVRDDDRLLDVPVNVKVLPETLVGGVIRQTADEQFRVGGVLLLRRGRRQGSKSLHQLVGSRGPHGADRAHGTETRRARHQHPPNFGDITAGRDNDLLNLDTFFGTAGQR